MNSRKPFIIAMAVILLTSFSWADFVKCSCTGTCHGREVEQQAAKSYEVFALDEEEECIARAKGALGGHCGGLADCKSDCADINMAIKCEDARSIVSDCCDNWCSGFVGDDEYCNCILACEGKCMNNRTINESISIIQYISVALAALVLAFHGVRLMTSDSPGDRDEAKHDIRYVFIALIIIFLATTIADLLFASVKVPSPGSGAYLAGCTITGTGDGQPQEPCEETSCPDIDKSIDSALSSISGKSQLLDKNLVLAIIDQESDYHQCCFGSHIGVRCNSGETLTSGAGALGLMQLMPGTAQGEGVDPHEAEENVEGGVSYINKQLQTFNDRKLALAAYNWGPGFVGCSIGKSWSACSSNPGWDKCGGKCDGNPTWECLETCDIPQETKNYVNNIMSNYGSASCPV